MHLIESYALACGAKINRPKLTLNFYPVPFQKYITFHCSSGMESKNYSFWKDVYDYVLPELRNGGIGAVQIGGEKDFRLYPDVLFLGGATSISQSLYIISKSLLHVANDTFSVHAAGILNVPLVAVYGSTTVKNHGPFFKNDKTFCIESPRNGENPSFSRVEKQKMVDLIAPEDIANKILLALDAKTSIKEKTVFTGSSYVSEVFEVIPDGRINLSSIQGCGGLNVRMDICFNEDNLASILSQNRPCNIISDKEINPNLLKFFAKNIAAFTFYVDNSTDFDYISKVVAIGVSLRLTLKNGLSKEETSKTRIKFFDFPVFDPSVENKKPPQLREEKDLYFRTSKIIASINGYFPSLEHYKINKSFDPNLNVAEIIDCADFWQESEFFRIIKKT